MPPLQEGVISWSGLRQGPWQHILHPHSSLFDHRNWRYGRHLPICQDTQRYLRCLCWSLYIGNNHASSLYVLLFHESEHYRGANVIKVTVTSRNMHI